MTAETPKPLVIVAASHVSHIQAAVVCSKYHGLEIRIRSGGHDYEGLSYVSTVPFIILDMFNLRSIVIDEASETAWVEAGATLGELYYAIANKSKILAFPAGVCPTLGTGGHFSGGGYGNLMRKYGLSVDNIIDAEIINANGTVLNRESMGEDLFWAIRGGGGASFGVILQWRIKLVPVPETVTYFKVERTLEEGVTDIAYQWIEVADKLPEELFIRAQPRVGQIDDKKTVTVSFIGLFLGLAEDLIPVMNRSIPELGLRLKDCTETSWIETELAFAGFPEGTPLDVLLNRTTSVSYFKYKSDYVREPISKAGLEMIWKEMMELGTMLMQWNPYGKRMSEIPESAVPFPHRAGIIFKIQYIFFWKEDGKEARDRGMGIVRRMHDFMTPYVTKTPREAFLNYRDLDIGNTVNGNKDASVYGVKYFMGNFQRLVRAKSMADPDNFFKSEQSIPPHLPY